MDRDYLVSLADKGLSTREIASLTGKSQTSVRHWLKKFNIKTKQKSFTDGYINSNKAYTSNLTKDMQCCSSCGIKLNDDNAYLRKSVDLYSIKCKKCASSYTHERQKEIKQKLVEYKGGKCKKCGYNKNLCALDFHHIDPSTKDIDIAKLLKRSWNGFEDEIDKCDLLCANCHREEHYRIDERNSMVVEFNKNLTVSLSDIILTGKNTGKESCKRCDTVLTEDNRAAGTKNRICKKCDSKYVMNKMIVGKRRAVEYMGGCCSVCGYNKCIRAIEFHHVDPAKKSPTYNKSFRSWGFDRQKKELENCIIVCSNCHREIHADLRLDEPE